MDSKLQIISGEYRGRKLKLSADARPTQNRTRIAVFNMLCGILEDTDNLHIWDAFAGTGAFGLECLSRYHNSNVVFSDLSATSVNVVRENLRSLAVGNRARVVQKDAISLIQSLAPDMDLVFLDPPYADSGLGRLFVKKFMAVAKNGAILVWEQEDTQSITPDDKDIEILRDKKYGRARFLILRKI